MDTTYVPTYLTSVERDAEGWPTFLTAKQREWLIEQVQRLTSTPDYVTIDNLVFWVFRQSDAPKWALRDAQYAAVHRALLAANCEQAWRMK
jgi:hypothetical protein